MKKTQNTYYKGINQDIAPNKSGEGTYFEAWNGHVATHEGDTSGNFVTDKGNSLCFKLPSQFVFHRIIGYGVIRNNLLIFTTGNSGNPELGNDDFIWRIVYTEATQSIQN